MAKDQTFCIVFGIANLGLFLYGLLALFQPGILYETFARQVDQFPADAQAAAGYLLALYRLLGFFNLLVGLAGLGLLWRFSIEPQPWLAWFVIGLSLLAYLAPLVFDNTVGEIGFFEVIEHILFAAMLVVGLARLKAYRPLFSRAS